MWDSVKEVLGVVHEDGHGPNHAAGFIEKWSVFNLFSFKAYVKVAWYHK